MHIFLINKTIEAELHQKSTLNENVPVNSSKETGILCLTRRDTSFFVRFKGKIFSFILLNWQKNKNGQTINQWVYETLQGNFELVFVKT